MSNRLPILADDIRKQSPHRLQVLLELRHARLRVDLAAVEIDWAASMLSAGKISADGALEILDEAVERLEGLSS